MTDTRPTTGSEAGRRRRWPQPPGMFAPLTSKREPDPAST